MVEKHGYDSGIGDSEVRNVVLGRAYNVSGVDMDLIQEMYY